jgi:hypothetical protein
MKAISYALFGFDRERAHNCFDFASYLRGLHLNIRFNRLIYGDDWITVLNVDEATYNSPYRPIFDWHESKGFLRISVFPNNEPLCRAMLRRVQTVFDYDHPEWRYEAVICRDLDSIATYRERQMVDEWIKEDKALHCITDSISHTIPMMGGMIGFIPGYVHSIFKFGSPAETCWDRLLAMAPDINYHHKGSDQDFLNRVMYPKLCTSATEHFIKGRPHDLAEGNGRHYRCPDTTLPINPAFTETNLLAGHIGAAGFYEAPTMKFLMDVDPFRKDYEELENMKEFDKLFYWQYREDFK